jgi:hypothetical protein
MDMRDTMVEMIGFGFDNVSDAKRVANFGAKLAPSNRVMKVTVEIEEVK